MDQKDDLKLVYSGNLMDTGLVDQILKANNIQTIIKNQYMGSIAPWHVSAGGHDPVDIYVRKEDFENAKELIQDFFDSE